MHIIPRQGDALHIIQELTELFANLKFKQQLLRRGMPLTTTWDDVRYDTNKRADFVNSMLKLLRMAALLKYIMQYPELSKSKPTSHPGKQCERMLNANLMSDEREIEYLIIFLDIKIDLITSFERLVPSLERFSPQAINQAIFSRQQEIKNSLLQTFSATPNQMNQQFWLAALHKALEVKMHSHEMDLAIHLGLVDCIIDEFRHPVNFSFIVIPENFLALHERYFYKECSRCEAMGLLALCLICGDVVCLKDCDLETSDEPQTISRICLLQLEMHVNMLTKHMQDLLFT